MVLRWASDPLDIRDVLDQAEAMREGWALPEVKWHQPLTLWKNSMETKRGKSGPGEGYSPEGSGPWDSGQLEDARKQDWEEPQTEDKYWQCCLFETHAHFPKKLVIKSTREKVEHTEWMGLAVRSERRWSGDREYFCWDTLAGVWRHNKIH